MAKGKYSETVTLEMTGTLDKTDSGDFIVIMELGSGKETYVASVDLTTELLEAHLGEKISLKMTNEKELA